MCFYTPKVNVFLEDITKVFGDNSVPLPLCLLQTLTSLFLRDILLAFNAKRDITSVWEMCSVLL